MSMTGTVPPETFRLYPEPDRPEFFVVHFAETLAEMYAVYTEHHGLVPKKGLLACCMGVESEDWPELLGILMLARNALSPGIVSHELAHAAFRYLERRGEQVRHWQHRGRIRAWFGGVAGEGKGEELYATVVETLTDQFWTELARLNERA